MMSLEINSSAQKELKTLPKSIVFKVIERVLLLKDDPFPLYSKKLQGGHGYRIRIGDYRVVYTVDTAKKKIVIQKVAHRKEVYRF